MAELVDHKANLSGLLNFALCSPKIVIMCCSNADSLHPTTVLMCLACMCNRAFVKMVYILVLNCRLYWSHANYPLLTECN